MLPRQGRQCPPVGTRVTVKIEGAQPGLETTAEHTLAVLSSAGSCALQAKQHDWCQVRTRAIILYANCIKTSLLSLCSMRVSEYSWHRYQRTNKRHELWEKISEKCSSTNGDFANRTTAIFPMDSTCDAKNVMSCPPDDRFSTRSRRKSARDLTLVHCCAASQATRADNVVYRFAVLNAHVAQC